MKKIAYITNLAPHYREELWLAFSNHLDKEIHFYFGSQKSKTIKSINFKQKNWHDYQNQIHKVNNIYFKKRLIFQIGVIGKLIFNSWDAVIIYSNANIISNWFLVLIAKLKGTPILMWGHGMYGTENKINKIKRLTFLSFADLILLYGNWAKNLLIKENFDPNKIKVIYNSVNYENSKALRGNSQVKDFYFTYFKNYLPTLIFIGRLTKIKRLDILIEALSILNKNQRKFNLIIIGDGEVRSELEQFAIELNVNVHFYGDCYDEQQISQFLANADLCVSPGNVGLTSIHSMSYGTPVCTNSDFENQMPEFEAITEGKTGCFFDKSMNNLAETISEWFQKAPRRDIVRKYCYEVIDKYYNPRVQVEILRMALKSFDED